MCTKALLVLLGITLSVGQLRLLLVMSSFSAENFYAYLQHGAKGCVLLKLLHYVKDQFLLTVDLMSIMR